MILVGVMVLMIAVAVAAIKWCLQMENKNFLMRNSDYAQCFLSNHYSFNLPIIPPCRKYFRMSHCKLYFSWHMNSFRNYIRNKQTSVAAPFMSNDYRNIIFYVLAGKKKKKKLEFLKDIKIDCHNGWTIQNIEFWESQFVFGAYLKKIS